MTEPITLNEQTRKLRDEVREEAAAAARQAIASDPTIARIANSVDQIANSSFTLAHDYESHPGYAAYKQAHTKLAEQLGGKIQSPGIEARAKGETGELILYEAIDDEPFGVSAKTIIAEMKDLRKKGVKNLDIRINSPGGSVFDALAVYARLKEWPGEVNVFIDGVAASAASVVAMAGKKIRIAETGVLMVHKPWTVAMGNAVDFRETADLLDLVERQLVKAYAGRSGLDEKKIVSLLEGGTDGTWIEAEEAVELGFADEIVENERIAASHDIRKYLAFYNAPDEIVEKATAEREMSLDDLSAQNEKMKAAMEAFT